MIKRITKEQIIKALKTETFLRPNAFFDSEIELSDPFCHVCAVGSVIRNSISQDEQIDKADQIAFRNTLGARVTTYFDEDAVREGQELLAKGLPWNALSVVYEGYCGLDDDQVMFKEARRRTIAFVKKYFPATVKLDIAGAKPRRSFGR